MRDALEYGALRAVEVLLAALPAGVARGAGARVGRLALGAGVRREVVEAQLRAAFPDRPEGWITRTTIACYEHFGEEVASLIRLGRRPQREFLERTEGVGELRTVWDRATRGSGGTDDRYLRGGGAIVVTGHVGNWELGGAAMAGAGIPISVVVKGMRNERVDRRLTDLRRRLGMETIDMARARRGVPEALERGRAVALVADQDARESGVFVPFLGRPASTFRGPALLALRHRVPLLFGLFVREDEGWRVTLEPVWRPGGGGARSSDASGAPGRDADADQAAADSDSVRDLTRAWVARLEEEVRARPEQYFWLHRRWKTRPIRDPSSSDRVDRAR